MRPRFFVSIMVCLYNQKDTLRHILAALAAQETALPYEIMLADDGSDLDNLMGYFSLIKETENTCKAEIKFAYQADRGFRLSRSRNNALDLASGDLVILLDGDVIPDAHLVEHHAETHQVVSPALVFTNRKHKNMSEIGTSGDSASAENATRAEREKDTKTHMREWQRVWGFNMSFYRPLDKKSVIRFNEKFVGWGLDDAEFAYRLSKKHGYKITCNEKVSTYHINPPKISDNPYKTLDPQDLLKFVNNAITFIEEYDFDDEIVRAVLPTIPKYDATTGKIVGGKSPFLLNEAIRNSAIISPEELIKGAYELRDALQTKYARAG